MQSYSLESDSDENEVGSSEWTRYTKLTGCSWVNKEEHGERYNLHENKCDEIFNRLLQEKHLSLLPNHVHPSAEELKKKKWCKWYNSPPPLHTTPMNVEYSSGRFNWPLNKGVSSSCIFDGS
jgi:hypothetical protein